MKKGRLAKAKEALKAAIVPFYGQKYTGLLSYNFHLKKPLQKDYKKFAIPAGWDVIKNNVVPLYIMEKLENYNIPIQEEIKLGILIGMNILTGIIGIRAYFAGRTFANVVGDPVEFIKAHKDEFRLYMSCNIDKLESRL